MVWNNMFKKKNKTEVKLKLVGEIPKDIDSKEFRDSLKKATDKFTPFVVLLEKILSGNDLDEKQKFALGMSLGAMVMVTHKKIMEKHVDMKNIENLIPEELKNKIPPSYIG